MVNPVLYKNLEPIIGTKADSEHRVLSDIDASITEYRAYLDNFFFVGD
jgi:oligoribonuclease (3'-5' exoribonuclease)